MPEYVVYYYIITNIQYLCRNWLCFTTLLQIYNAYAGICCVLLDHHKFTIPVPMPEYVVYYTTSLQIYNTCAGIGCFTTLLQRNSVFSISFLPKL